MLEVISSYETTSRGLRQPVILHHYSSDKKDNWSVCFLPSVVYMTYVYFKKASFAWQVDKLSQLVNLPETNSRLCTKKLNLCELLMF